MRDLLPKQYGGHTATVARERQSWVFELGSRVRSSFVLTVLWTTFLTGIFFIGYFFVQRHPAYTPTVMPQDRLGPDDPVQPPALVAYVSLWIYIGVGPGLQRTFREFAVYGSVDVRPVPGWTHHLLLLADPGSLHQFWPRPAFRGFRCSTALIRPVMPALRCTWQSPYSRRFASMKCCVRRARRCNCACSTWRGFLAIAYSTHGDQTARGPGTSSPGRFWAPIFALMSLRITPGNHA